MNEDMELIDGYTHCGLSKYEPVERVEEVMAAAGVGRAVLVQHLGEFDNSYLGRIAAEQPTRFAAVCLVDHEAADCVTTLQRLATSGCFKGLRLTHDALEARPALADAAIDSGLIIVFYGANGVTPAAPLLSGLLHRHPDARLVLSHLGQPDPADSPQFAHSDAMWRWAEYPNVYVQLSGMKMFCAWPHEALYPFIEKVIEHFGPARLFWGSNFPVVGDTSDYRNDLLLLLEGKLPVAASDIPAVAGGNAKKLWFPGR